MSPQTLNTRIDANAEINCVDFARSFVWYEEALLTNLKKTFKEFWNLNLDLKLFAINNKPDFLWHGTDYFVTQVGIVEDITCFARLSRELVQVLLDSAFGIRQGDEGEFNFKQLTELEADIVTKFNDFVYKNFRNEVFQNDTLLRKISYAQDWKDEIYHFLVTVYPNNNDLEPGKLILSVSKKIMKEPELLKVPETPYSFSAFKNCLVPVAIEVGSTKVSVDDLKSIEVEDILLLDNSNISKLRIKEYGIEFNINPDPSLVMDLGEEGGDSEVLDESLSQSNKWDNIQIDVGAEFKKVKLSLGELRQMSEGLIVDIAPVFQNEITLQVDNSPVAKGELVIIGERYGVKLTKILREDISEDDEPEIMGSSVPPQNVNSQSDVQEAHGAVEEQASGADLEDDDFDYSDFEIDDDI